MAKDNLLLTFLLAFLFSEFLIVLVVIYLAFFHHQIPIEFFDEPFQTDKEFYYPGEAIKITASYCRYVDVGMERSMEFRDTVIVPLSPVWRPGTEPGCNTITLQVATVPENFPPSNEVTIHAKSTYWVNPIGKRTVSWRTQPFKVLAKE